MVQRFLKTIAVTVLGFLADLNILRDVVLKSLPPIPPSNVRNGLVLATMITFVVYNSRIIANRRFF